MQTFIAIAMTTLLSLAFHMENERKNKRVENWVKQ